MKRTIAATLVLGVAGASVAVLLREEAPRSSSVAPGSGERASRASDRASVALSELPEEARQALEPAAPAFGSSPLARAPLTIEVLDAATGGLVAGARVEVTFDGVCGDSWRRELTTDADGRTRFASAPGRVSAVAWTDERASRGAEVALDGASPGLLSLELEPGVAVCGLARDLASGEPIAGLTVSISTSLGRTARTDADGRFQLGPLPAAHAAGTFLELRGEDRGRYAFLLSAAPDGGWSVCGGTGLDFAEREGTGNPIRLAIGVGAGREIVGRVVDARSGTPAAGVRVSISGYCEAASGVRLPDARDATTDAAGRFAVKGLRRDALHRVTLASDAGAAPALAVRPGEEPRVDCGTIPLEQTPPVVGNLVDALGRPLEGVRVRLTALDDPAMLGDASGAAGPGGPAGLVRPGRATSPGPGSSVRPGRSRPPAAVASEADLLRLLAGSASRCACTDERGSFQLGRVAPGAYRFQAFSISSDVLDSRELRLPEEAGVLVGIQVASGSSVAGRVVDAEGPVPGARVVLTRGSSRQAVTADAEGCFLFGGLSPSESYEAFAFAEGGGAARATRGVPVHPNGASDLELVLAAAGSR